MKDEIVYKKIGKRYREVGKELDLYDLYDFGAHLVVVQSGCKSIVRKVDIDAAGVLAAMKISADAMASCMSRAADLMPSKQVSPITVEQRELLDKLAATGFNTSVWTRRSLMEVVEAGMKELKAVMDSE